MLITVNTFVIVYCLDCLESSGSNLSRTFFLVSLEEGFISADLERTHLDCSVIFFTVPMYFCTVAEFFSSCLSY